MTSSQHVSENVLCFALRIGIVERHPLETSAAHHFELTIGELAIPSAGTTLTAPDRDELQIVRGMRLDGCLRPSLPDSASRRS